MDPIEPPPKKKELPPIKDLLPTGTRGRNWQGSLSYIPKDQTTMQKFKSIHKKYLLSPREQLPVIEKIAKLEKTIKKDNQTFRSKIVDIMMTTNIEDKTVGEVEQEEEEMTEKEKMQRYYYFIINGVDTQHVADMEEKWLTNILALIPLKLLARKDQVEYLSMEMKEDYCISVKKAIVDFVLKDPREKSLEIIKESMEDMEDFKHSVKTWSDNYIQAKALLSTQLILTNQNVSDIFHVIYFNKVWERFKTTSLIDVQSICGTNELKAFKSLIVTKLEKQTEKLLTTYFPSILNIFYQGSKKKVWTSIANDRLESFFRMISLIMCDQIRQIIKQTALDYISLFDPLQGVDGTKGIKFGIKVVLDDIKIKLDPSTADIQSTLESLLDLIFIAGDKIPKIETQLFVGNNIKSGAPVVKQDQCLNICFEQTFPGFCTVIRKKLTLLLKRALQTPTLYLNEYDVHKALISRASDVDVTEYLATPKSQDSMMEEIRKYRNLASKIMSSFPFSVEFPIVELQCGDFIQSLADRAVGLANRIVDRMSISFKELNDKIIYQFEQMAKIVQQMPTTVDEMCNLQKFMDSSRLIQMKALEEQVDEAKKKLNFMITYSELKKEDYDQNSLLFQWPMKIGPIFLDGEQNLIKSRHQNTDELTQRREKLQSELETYTKQIDEYYSYGEYSEINKYLKTAQRFQSRLETIGEKIANFNREEDIFGWEMTKFNNLSQTVEQLQPFLTLYSTSVDLQKQYQLWMTGSFLSLNAEQIEQEVTQMWRNSYKLSETFKDFHTPLELARITKEQIEKFKVHLPLIATLCNPGLRERHWKDISQIIGFRFQPDENTSLASVLERNFSNYMNELEQISAVATKEFSFEKALAKMYQEWKDILFITLEYRDTGTQILGGTEEIQILLDDHILKTQTMRGSPFIKAFDEETKIWDAKLVLIQEILDEWLKVQSTWLYLEPIFSSEDIMRQMPSEGKKFVSVNKTWKDIMIYTANDPHVLRVCDMPDFLAILKDANLNLELIQKGLNQYLEVKRLYFPRFFFLSNDEMLEILSETRFKMLTKRSNEGTTSPEKMF